LRHFGKEGIQFIDSHFVLQLVTYASIIFRYRYNCNSFFTPHEWCNVVS
jgi:hypothetical protein